MLHSQAADSAAVEQVKPLRRLASNRVVRSAAAWVVVVWGSAVQTQGVDRVGIVLLQLVAGLLIATDLVLWLVDSVRAIVERTVVGRWKADATQLIAVPLVGLVAWGAFQSDVVLRARLELSKPAMHECVNIDTEQACGGDRRYGPPGAFRVVSVRRTESGIVLFRTGASFDSGFAYVPDNGLSRRYAQSETSSDPVTFESFAGDWLTYK